MTTQRRRITNRASRRTRAHYVLRRGGEAKPGRPPGRRDPVLEVHEGRAEDDRPARRDRATGPRGGDRKSTRLNSSHANISYAVFCLKKKTINERRHRLDEGVRL